MGTQRDKSTLDASTNRINWLLSKVKYNHATKDIELNTHALVSVLNIRYTFDQVRSIRMSGSCALDLCEIACGRLDLFYLVGFGGPW